jgi:hypothetical protein
VDKALDALARKIQPKMTTDRFKFDREQIGDVITIVRETVAEDMREGNLATFTKEAGATTPPTRT